MHIQILTSDPQGHHPLPTEPAIHVQSPSYLLEKVAELEQQVRELQAWKGRAVKHLENALAISYTGGWAYHAIVELLNTPTAPDSG